MPESLEEIDDFLEKATVLQSTIRGISDGTLDPNTTSLRQYGILTTEEQAAQKKEQEIELLAHNQRRERKKAVEKEQKRVKWWETAVYLHGPKIGDEEEGETVERMRNGSVLVKEEEERALRLARRYSSDYSHWSEGRYIPDDEATREEEEREAKIKEDKESEVFEKRNQEWCDEMKRDMAEREKAREEDEASATQLRLKGNIAMRKGKFVEAVRRYEMALEKTPYEISVLGNMAIAFGKMGRWMDSIEFCDRTLYLNQDHIKALYHRSRAYTSIDRLDKALLDIDRCIELDNAQKSIFLKHRQELKYRIKNEHLEKIFAGLDPDGIDNLEDRHANFTDNSLPTFCNLPIESLSFAVTINKDDINYTNVVKKQCRIVNHCMEYLKRTSPSHNNEGREAVDREHIYTIFCEKIRTCAITGVYIRFSGHLKNAVDMFVQYRKQCPTIASESIASNAGGKDILAKREIPLILGVIAEVVSNDPLSREIVRESGALAIAVMSVSSIDRQEADVVEDIEILTSELTLVATCIDVKGQTIVNDQTIFPNIVEFLRNLYRKINYWSKMARTIRDCRLLKAISVGADVIFSFTKCNTIRDKIHNQIQNQDQTNNERWNAEVNPVTSLAIALQTSPPDQSKSNKAVLVFMRRSIVQALQGLSVIEELSDSFISEIALQQTPSNKRKLATALHVLLAISISFASESEVTREMALITVYNIIMTIKNGHPQRKMRIGRHITSCDGIEMLINLCISNESCSAIKIRASTLVDNLLLSMGDLFRLTEEQTHKIWIEYSKIMGGRQKAIEKNDTEHNVTFAGVLIRIIALSIEKMRWSDPLCAHYLMKMLPKPRKGASGNITPESVCLPPELCDFASSPSIYCNVLKVIIAYVDSSPVHHERIRREAGIECFVCLITNASKLHPSVTKNAASILARMIKSGDSSIKQRCRDLRGIEILTQLSRDGKL